MTLSESVPSTVVQVQLPESLDQGELVNAERTRVKSALQAAGLDVTESGPLLKTSVPDDRLDEIERLIGASRANIVYQGKPEQEMDMDAEL